MSEIILASNSPRRKEILKNAGINFKVIPSNFDEKFTDLNFSKEKIEKIAFMKGNNVAQRYPKDIIISVDTVVVYNNTIFTKPKNKEHAFDMLKTLSGQTHFVQTSTCIIKNNTPIIKSLVTYVTFNNIEDSEVKNYIEAFKPFDKAGAYGIQELPKNFIYKIDGDIENVIGISSDIVKELLRVVNINGSIS